MKRSGIVIFILLLFITTPLYAAERLGVVLMHGKDGTSHPNSPIGKLASYLEENGILVIAPEMPWSRDRGLDKTYEASMQEIDVAVAELKNQGATRIVVGGHSMGANAALGYSARRKGLTGIMAIAPGHSPELSGFQDRVDNDWQRAKAMIDEGRGNETAGFSDINQGKSFQRKTSALIYLSWFDPEGPAIMPVNITKLQSGTALLWIIGERDRMYDRGEEYAFSKAPDNAHNQYVVVKGGHFVTPIKGKEEILEWLRSL